MARPRSALAVETVEFESLRRELELLRASEAELRTALQLLRSAHTADGIAMVVGTLVRWVCGSVMCYFCYLAVGTLAGKTSMADIGIRFLGSLDADVVMSWAVSLGGLAFGLRQSALRRRTVRRLRQRNAELEVLVAVEPRAQEPRGHGVLCEGSKN